VTTTDFIIKTRQIIATKISKQKIAYVFMKKYENVLLGTKSNKKQDCARTKIDKTIQQAKKMFININII
jgi:hypothetical protein